MITPRQWATTGDQQRVDPSMLVDRLPDFDPRTGDHLWMVMSGYRVVPEQWHEPTHTPMLDAENLLTITVPFCYYCEQAWSERLATRRCRGHG
jgi:hypothetical protein